MAGNSNYGWWIAGAIIVALFLFGGGSDLFFKNKIDSCKTTSDCKNGLVCSGGKCYDAGGISQSCFLNEPNTLEIVNTQVQELTYNNQRGSFGLCSNTPKDECEWIFGNSQLEIEGRVTHSLCEETLKTFPKKETFNGVNIYVESIDRYWFCLGAGDNDDFVFQTNDLTLAKSYLNKIYDCVTTQD